MSGLTDAKDLFRAWYTHNRDYQLTAHLLGVDVVGLRHLGDKGEWDKLADEHDRALTAVYRQTTNRMSIAEMIARHIEVADSLISFGATYLETHGVDNSRDAVAAIKVGVELQRRCQELPDHIVGILNATDDDLLRKAVEVWRAVGTAVEELESGVGVGGVSRVGGVELKEVEAGIER